MNLPDVLYKYRTYSDQRHLDILTKNCIYFASPDSFEDPLDCRPPEVLPDKEIIWTHFWDIVQREHPSLSYEDKVKLTKTLLKQSPIINPDSRQQLLSELFLDYCRCHGVLSLTADPSNDDMWTKYADNHYGFCVGFDSVRIASISGGGGPVTYCEELPVIHVWVDDTETEHVKRVYYKEKKWEFEKEYRLHKVWPLEALSRPVNRIALLPKKSIVSVICGYNMPKEHINILKQILQKYQPDAVLMIES